MATSADTQYIYPDVQLGDNAKIGRWVVLGERPEGMRSAPIAKIGENATIRSHTVIYYGNQIGDNLQTGHHVLIRELNQIGSRVSIGTGSVVEHHVEIADGVRIHSQAFVPEYCILEEECWLGPRVALTNARYPASPDAKHNLVGVTVGRRARIGANATILPGIKIGPEALVGAGAVVVKDVPPGAVVAGNPARVMNSIDNLPY